MCWLSFNMLANTELFVLLCLCVAMAVPISAGKLGHKVTYWKGLITTELLISGAQLLGYVGWAITTRAVQHQDLVSMRFAGFYLAIAVLTVFAIYPVGFLIYKADQIGSN